MSIEIRLFDLFAYAVPGAIYLYIIVEISRLLGLDPAILDPFLARDLLVVIFIFVVSYVLGHLMETVSLFLRYDL